MTLEPEFHFLEVAYPYVARWVGRPGRACSMLCIVTQCGWLQLCWGAWTQLLGCQIPCVDRLSSILPTLTLSLCLWCLQLVAAGAC